MTGLPSPQGSGAWRHRFIWLATAAFALVIALLLVSPLPRPIHLATSGGGLVGGGLALAVACRYQAARSVDRRRHRAWTLSALAGVTGTVGNLWLLLAGGSMGPDAPISPADVCLLLALLFGLAAVFTFPATPRRPAEIVRMVMDGIVIGGSLLFFASVTLFPQILGPTDTLANRALPLLVPVFDITAATAAFLLYLRRNPADGPFLGLLSAGFALFSISDFASAVITVEAPFSFGTPADLGWIAGYLTLALAVYTAPRVSAPPLDRPRERSAVASTTLTFVVFLLAAATNAWQQPADALSRISTVLWFVVVIGVIGRQVSLIVDNERMRRVLEERVIEGSRNLQTLSQRTDLLVNSVGDGIYGVDPRGVITFANPMAERILGYDRDTLIGRHAHSSFHAQQPNGQPYPDGECYVTEAIVHGVVTNAEEDNYVRSDGRIVPVEVTASPTTAEGRSIGAVVVFRDVTQRQEVDRVKNEFVSIVSHELRTPLTSIRGSLGLVASGRLGEIPSTANRMITIALESSIRLGRLINDILDVERIHSGVMPMEVGEHRAADLIAAAAREVNVLAERASVRVEVGDVAGAVVADRYRVEQTLINLLDNAIKFSPAGTAVHVRTEPLGSFVEFVISDSGRGIPPHKLDAIFRRFEQVDSSDARDKGGTGLGLAISRSIVERLGGRIWAENNQTVGATLRFTLPRATSASAPSPAPQEESMQASSY